MSDDDSPRLKAIKEEALDEGHTADTPAFERRVRQLQVIKCRTMRGHYSCQECPAFDDCELVKRVLRDKKGYE